MTNKILEDLEAMTNTTPSDEKMGRYLCFVSDETDRAEFYLTFSQNLRISPNDRSSGFWRGFCDYAEQNHRYRKPSSEELAKIDSIWVQIEKFHDQRRDNQKPKGFNEISDLHNELDHIAYNLQEKIQNDK